jgi:chitin synthase
MHGIIRNIRHLVSRTNSKTWGEGAWEKVVVCIVADGRKKCNEKVYQYLAAMGVYQEGIAKREVNGKPVTAHIYEVIVALCAIGIFTLEGMDDTGWK